MLKPLLFHCVILNKKIIKKRGNTMHKKKSIKKKQCSNQTLKEIIGGDRYIKQGNSSSSVANCILSLFKNC